VAAILAGGSWSDLVIKEKTHFKRNRITKIFRSMTPFVSEIAHAQPKNKNIT